MRRLLPFVLLVLLAMTAASADQVRIRIRKVVPPAAGGGGGLQAHPRLWWTSAVAARVDAKRVANDPDWLAVKNGADAALTKSAAKCTITAATNSNPVTFTCAETVPFPSTSTVYILNGTGAWAGVNTPTDNGIYSPRVATKTGTNTFTQPIDSTSFGSFTGQSLSTFILDGENTTTYIGWEQYGTGILGTIANLAIVYKTIGGASYLNKALELLDAVNEWGAGNNPAPQSVDAGRAGAFKTIALAEAYDWLYADLSTARRNATIQTLNLWATWTTAGYGGTGPAYTVNPNIPTSNYWQGNLTYVAAVGYATFEENASAQSWLDWAASEWTNDLVPMFQAPSTTATGYTQGQGAFYGGGNFLGWNYGGNDIARRVSYLMLVKSATGNDVTNGVDYAKRWANAIIYELKPDRYKTVTWGRWTSNYYGVVNLSGPMFLAGYLAGTTEGGWAQWFYNHVTYGGGVNANEFQANSTDRLMFYDAAATQIDYTVSEPTAKFVDGTLGYVSWRSNWTTSADFASFRVTPTVPDFGEIAKDAGHIDITRGTDYLLVQTNSWKGTTDGLSGNPQLYERNNALNNSLYFFDGAGAQGGYCFGNGIGSQYDGCQLAADSIGGPYRAPTVKIDTNYVFAENQFSNAYRNGSQQTNLTYWFRSFFIVGDGLYVVWDRAKSAEAFHTKTFRWHFPAQNQPTVNVPSDIVSASIGSSTIFMQPLGAATPTLELVRDQSNTTWRIDVTDPVPAQTYNVFTVFAAMATAGAAMPTTARLAVVDTNFDGVQIGGTTPKVVVVPVGVTNTAGVYTSTPYSGCSFETTHAGTARYVVAGLAAGAWTVRRNGVSIATPTVGSDGTTTFTATAGQFTLTKP